MLDAAAIYKALLPELKSFIYRLTCDREVSNDIAQDTFLRVLEKHAQYKGSAAEKTWLFSIAANLSIDWLRRKKRWTEYAQDEARAFSMKDETHRRQYLQIHASSAAGAFEIREHINFCFSCIAKTLTIEQQVAIILKDIYAFKIDEIVQVLSAPPGTVKHWLFTGRKQMTEIFDRRCALVKKEGVCYQCSELNGLFNPKQPVQNPFPSDVDKDKLYQLRTQLIKGIDPLNSRGSDLEDGIMQVLRRAIRDDE